MCHLLFLLQISLQNIEARIGPERVSSILWCLGIIIATLLLKRPLAFLIANTTSLIANRFGKKEHAATFKALMRRPLESLLTIVLFYVALNQLTILLGSLVVHRLRGQKLFDVSIGDIVDHLFLFLIIIYTTHLISRLIDFIFYLQMHSAEEKESRERQQLLPLLKEIAKLIFWTIGVFWVLGSVFHVNIPALITGLGIGGVAIALAAKETVENFFAAFTILTDRPFQTGDVIRLGNIEGNVERIGFRSTQLRNADGSSYIIPNKKLVNENLENLTQRDTRRVKVTVPVKYGLTHAEVEEILKDITSATLETAHVIKPVEVTLDSFAENVFNIVVSYHLPHPLAEGGHPAAVKKEINLGIYSIVSRYIQSIPEPAQEGDKDKRDEKDDDKPDGDETLLA